jgi:aminopeptidase N
VFFTTLRGVIRSFAGKAISLETLEGAFANTAPSSDIPGFFRQWTHGTRAPVLDVEWWSGADGRGIEFTVRQLQPGPPFRFPLEVEATMRDGTTARHVLDVSERSAAFRRDTPGRVVSLRLDPGRRVLMWRPSYGPRPADAGP